MPEKNKRKADSKENNAKRQKYSKFKATNRGNDNTLSSLRTIEAGWSGIWATCVRGMEAKATGQLRDVLDEYAAKLYPEAVEALAAAPVESKTDEANTDKPEGTGDDEDDDEEGGDIEAAIKSELKQAKAPQKQLFKTVRIDIACVLFFRVEPPIDAVTIVQHICDDAVEGRATKMTRHINRLTPMALIDKATLEGIQRVGEKVLWPVFKAPEYADHTFAIRLTMRNHNVLKKEKVIDKVAGIVGDDHKVDLSKPDLIILVDIYTNICGMSVVDARYENEFKRFNLSELYGNKVLKSKDAKNEDNTAKKDDSKADTTDAAGKVDRVAPAEKDIPAESAAENSSA